MAEDRVLSQLDQARVRLLDLSLRNRLLNFKPTKRQTIRIVDELPGEIWRILVSDEKKMGFLPKEEHELYDGHVAMQDVEDGQEQDADEEVFVLPELDVKQAQKDGVLPRRYRDAYLQTALSSENLQTNLLRIYQAANSALQERGVNFLFLAVGFLEWKQTATSDDRIFKSPLLLIPVALERSSARSRFVLSALDDEPVLNPCLVRKLEDYRIALPPDTEDWDSFNIDNYLKKVSEAVLGQSGWSISRDICLGLFSFAKYLMYVDLDPGRWPIASNPLVRALCGDERSLPAPAALPESGDLDRIAPKQVFQILDADSSQQTAILRAKAGQSFVIEGPPGTGKSQTITNIIAECLAQKKTVLFVSEKMAALEVVKSRLDTVGLGDFVLELHSTKANRKTLTAELDRVLTKGRPSSSASEDGAQKLSTLRDRLNNYDRALHEPFGPAGMTPFQAMGRLLLLSEVSRVDCKMPGYEKWNARKIADIKERVGTFARQLAAVWPLDEHPWRGARLTMATGQVQQTAADLVERLLTGLSAMTNVADELAATLDVTAPDTIQANQQRLEDAALLLSSPELIERLLADPIRGNPPEELNQLLSSLSALTNTVNALAAALDVAAPDTIEATAPLLEDADLLVHSPGPAERLLVESLLDNPPEQLKQLLIKIKTYTKFQQWLEGRYKPDEVERIDWQGMLDRCHKFWAGFGRLLRRSYWADRKAFKNARIGGEFPPFEEILSDLKQLVAIQRLRAELEQARPLGEKYFDAIWRGTSTSLEKLHSLQEWLEKFHTCVRRGGVGPAAFGLTEVAGADQGELALKCEELRQTIAAWQRFKAELKQARSGENNCTSAGHGASTSLEKLLSLREWLGKFHARVRRGGTGGPTVEADRSELAMKHEGLRQAADAWRQLKAERERTRPPGENELDFVWQGPLAASLETLRSWRDWLEKFRACVRRGGIGPAAFGLTAAGADRRELSAACDGLRQTMNAWQADWAALTQAVQMNDAAAFGLPVAEVPLSRIAQRLEQMDGRHESLVDWSHYMEAWQACNKGPLADFAARVLADGLDPDVFVLAMEKQFLTLWMNDVWTRRPELQKFNGRNHEADQSDFASLDKEWVGRTSSRLQAILATDRPSNAGGYAQSSQLGILRSEISRKRGGRTIRQLLVAAKDAMQKLKPCFMMSPLSVAQFIHPRGMRFDVVVFDEASQVEPADALGAVARGGQLILVGDPKQLPPTSFFSGLGVEAETIEENDDAAAGLTDMESILDKGLTVFPSTRLRWHYRSRHESLIAFSNREFYDNDLVVFPSCHANRDELGLSMEWHDSDVYDRGKSQTNRDQAKRIAHRVFEHARKHPDKTLGVGAFSQKQQQAIWDEIERLRREDDSVESFFDPGRQEPFFVKNLETIQGDERDVILLSVGYGRNPNTGRVSMNFGPLNKDGGWRRLNVLVTRARQKCVVFSSIRGDDLDLSATQARGVHAMKGYLDYALTGQLPEIEVGQGEFGSDFEKAVHDALIEKGLQLHSQVGCAGYAIDLAVVDPEKPGRYLLGIECDGATYHRSATARDRDRLRQQVLEGLGWRIHRIWSTEWFQKPQSEVKRVLEAVRQAQAGLLRPRFAKAVSVTPKPASLFTAPPQDVQTPSSDLQPPLAIIPTKPYVCFAPPRVFASEKFYTGSVSTLAQQIVEIVAAEGPIHEDELARRITTVFGMTRTGSQIVTKVRKASDHAERNKTITRKGPFLWPADMSEPPVRVRNGDSKDTPRDIDRVCPEEIGQAAWLLLKAQFGMSRQDLITQTARALGFNNTGTSIAFAIETALNIELKTGRIQDNGSSLCAMDAPSV